MFVRLDNIGDFIIWSLFFPSIRRCFKSNDEELVLICNQSVAKIAEQSAIFSRVIPVDVKKFVKSPLYRFSILREVKINGPYRSVINPTFSREVWKSDSIIRAAQAKEKIGFFGDYANILRFEKNISDKWYTKLVKIDDAVDNELQKNMEFMKALFPHLQSLPACFLPDLFPQYFNSRISCPYVVIFPGASWPGRQWPTSNFEALVDNLTNRGYFCVVAGSASDSSLAKEMNVGLNSLFLDLTGKTSIMELGGLIQGATLLITNETSAAHIGSATGTPTICIIGGGHFGRFLPYIGLKNPPPMKMVYVKMDCFGCNWNCTQGYSGVGPVPCVDGITISQVMREVDDLLISN